MNSAFASIKRPRGLMSLAGCLLVLGTWAVAQEAAPTQEKAKTAKGEAVPKLEVSDKVWDFGTVWAGEKVSKTVTLRNTGNATLNITKVKSSCGCTATKHTKKELAPGETEEIVISYNTKKKTERVRQTVRISTNDPAQPIATIEVRGTVKPILRIEPSHFVSLGRVGPDEQVTRTIDITCNYTEPLNLTMDLARPSDDVDIKWEVVEPGHRYRITATTKPPLKMGSLRAMMALKTGLDLLPQEMVQIHALVQPPVLVTPLKLMLMEQNSPQTQTLRMTNHTGREINITSAKASDPSITIEVLPRVERKKEGSGPEITNMRAQFPATSELPEGVTITVLTDDKEYSEFVIPVTKRIIKPQAKTGGQLPLGVRKPGKPRPPVTPVGKPKEPAKEKPAEKKP